ncbi:MAG: DUF4349 domain-containing protein, partial [Lachnospiraceae bacterium]|nr:DUF4349 domain-containing protein [Lachnospiraceae bacterium]
MIIHEKRRRTLLFIILVLMLSALLSVLSGCSAAKNAAEWRKDEAAYDAPQEKPGGYNAVPGADAPSSPEGGTDQDAGSYAQAPSVLSEEKLVYTCDMSIETTEYKETAAAIKAKVKEFGGIIESESETDNDNGWYYKNHTRYGATMSLYLTVRIPSERYSDFIESAGSLGKVRQKTQNVQNISRRYSDTEARIRALETEES